VPGNFLISEAVRGEGAVLLSEDGKRFMQSVHPAAELAPRDVVARGIAEQMAAQGGKPVLLDATAMSAEFLAARFPTIDAACERFGLDWSRQAVPVTPAAHYWMGGVRADAWGRTSVRGLFAVGEVACTGVHGANRLASNSLLESLVFAWRAAHLLLEDDDVLEQVWPDGDFDVLMAEADDVRTRVPVRREKLQQLMWEKVGIYRNEAGLREALAQLNCWSVAGTSVHDLETANLLALAKVIVVAALERRESRGAHYRNDFPETAAELQHQLVICERVAVPC
jgi:L-aspartate oxidase